MKFQVFLKKSYKKAKNINAAEQSWTAADIMCL